MNKEDKVRYDTMTRFRDLLKEKGEAETLKILEWYVGNGYTLQIKPEEYERFENEVKKTTMDTILILSLFTLRDEFGFGKDRLTRFKARFNMNAECLADERIKWKDIQDTLLAECSLKEEIRGSVWGKDV